MLKQLEQDILRVAGAEKERFLSRLAASGMSAQDPIVEVWQDDPSRRTSEIRIGILKDGQIDDVLEFHIFRDGTAVVSEAEVVEWLRSELNKLCEHRA